MNITSLKRIVPNLKTLRVVQNCKILDVKHRLHSSIVYDHQLAKFLKLFSINLVSEHDKFS